MLKYCCGLAHRARWSQSSHFYSRVLEPRVNFDCISKCFCDWSLPELPALPGSFREEVNSSRTWPRFQNASPLHRNNGLHRCNACRRDAIGAAVWLFPRSSPSQACRRRSVFRPVAAFFKGQSPRGAHLLQCGALGVVRNVSRSRRQYLLFALRSVLSLLSTDAPVRFKLLAIIRNVSPLAFRSRRRSSSSDVHFLPLLISPSPSARARQAGAHSMIPPLQNDPDDEDQGCNDADLNPQIAGPFPFPSLCFCLEPDLD